MVALPVSSEPAQSRPEDQTGNFRGIRLKGAGSGADRQEFLEIRPSRIRFKAPGISRPTQKTTPIREVGILARPGQRAERFP